MNFQVKLREMYSENVPDETVIFKNFSSVDNMRDYVHEYFPTVYILSEKVL